MGHNIGDCTPPRRRLTRHDTGERPCAPRELRRGLHARQQDSSKEEAKLPSVGKDENQMKHDQQVASAKLAKSDRLAVEDTEHQLHLGLLERGVFLTANRRSRSRTPPFVRA